MNSTIKTLSQTKKNKNKRILEMFTSKVYQTVY